VGGGGGGFGGGLGGGGGGGGVGGGVVWGGGDRISPAQTEEMNSTRENGKKG